MSLYFGAKEGELVGGGAGAAEGIEVLVRTWSNLSRGTDGKKLWVQKIEDGYLICLSETLLIILH